MPDSKTLFKIKNRIGKVIAVTASAASTFTGTVTQYGNQFIAAVTASATADAMTWEAPHALEVVGVKGIGKATVVDAALDLRNDSLSIVELKTETVSAVTRAGFLARDAVTFAAGGTMKVKAVSDGCSGILVIDTIPL